MRLDEEMNRRGLVLSRSQAENMIELGQVKVGSKIIRKPSTRVSRTDTIKLTREYRPYVSRAAYKLESAAKHFGLDFKGKTILDVGISTGGFTDYMLEHGAAKVIGVDVGTAQLHPTLIGDKRIELHEKTDIRDFTARADRSLDFITIDVSFISLRAVIPSILKHAGDDTKIIAMLKPQFEAGEGKKHKGIIKNSKMRREIIQNFETWLRNVAVIIDKRDSDVSGKKGNVERFYLLTKTKR